MEQILRWYHQIHQIPVNGQVWYNSTDLKLKGNAQTTVGAWASGGNLNTARKRLASSGNGIQTATINSLVPVKGAFHSSVCPAAGGVPPIAKAAAVVPHPAKSFLATFKSFCSDQQVPFHNSVCPVTPGAAFLPKAKAAV